MSDASVCFCILFIQLTINTTNRFNYLRYLYRFKLNGRHVVDSNISITYAEKLSKVGIKDIF